MQFTYFTASLRTSNEEIMPTYCIDCEWLHPDAERKPSYSWMCSKHPRTSGAQFVTDRMIDKDGPYLLCRNVNGGACPLWEPAKGEKK